MKIKQLKKGSRGLKEFQKREWAKANIEHYGENFEWKVENFLLEIYDKKELLGSLSFKVEAGVGYISTLIVAYGRQGNGIGTQLITKAEEIARKKGASKMYLVTGKGWKSVDFYQKLGYEVTAQLKKHYHGKDFLLLTKFF